MTPKSERALDKRKRHCPFNSKIINRIHAETKIRGCSSEVGYDSQEPGNFQKRCAIHRKIFMQLIELF